MPCANHADHAGPGKFENASCAVVAFYDQDPDRFESLASGGYWQEYKLTASERDEFELPADQDVLRIYTESSGFTYEVSWEPDPDSIDGYEPDDGEQERLAIELGEAA